ncbi:hypothetical protein ORI89_02835 [Sphingobacterium sp. UT-1RO-CII-1]|uniref:hypothetical protein n=1 Tax=Sphingobacterium sp. UT-1RO-CII-1 TaxID=2995225 RepID=UPI00227C3ADD|nr:hypothetical protein [Sphingobacterium sp. UT-1RO-CII-1]MCY4778571.1 hypothetical protein [Sphingobacterium sp. UT-1RO-CII-1]
MDKRNHIKCIIILTFLFFTNLILATPVQGVAMPKPDETENIPVVISNKTIEEQIVQLSKNKWQWIEKRQTDSLNILFHIDLISLAPGVRMDKAGYIDVIKNDISKYSEANILETEIQLMDDVSVLHTKVVFTQVERKIFMSVTEIYKKHKNSWQLIRLQVQPAD